MFFAWNVRGLNSNQRHISVKQWITTHGPLFGACLETHIQPNNSRRISNALPVGWKFFENSAHHGTARIVVVWHPSVIMTLYQASAQAVTCGFSVLAEDINLTVTFVYAYNVAEERCSLWEELSLLNASTPVSRFPWAVIGDFNQILRSDQHSNHPDIDVDAAGIDDFTLAMQEAELFESHTKGLPFSWWNNQDDNPISKRIDHFFVNQNWAQSFPNAFGEFLEPEQSDHAPCLVSMPSLRRRIVKPFKFFDHIVDHPNYLDSVKEAWNCVTIRGTYQFKLQRSLKLLKGVLRRLNRSHFSGITQRVKEQTVIVTDLQRRLLTNPDPITARSEHDERAKWQMLLKAEEKFYRQKSRVKWNHLGDRDTAFYHKTVIQRAASNHIHFLRDADDGYIGSIDQIKAHSATYFENILGHTDMPESPTTIRELQELLSFRCSDAQCEVLSRHVTAEEITKYGLCDATKQKSRS